MTKVYTPPTWRQIEKLGEDSWALRYGFPVYTVTYKVNGVWHNVQTLKIGEADGATSFFNGPATISDALATEMQAAGMPGTYV